MQYVKNVSLPASTTSIVGLFDFFEDNYPYNCDYIKGPL